MSDGPHGALSTWRIVVAGGGIAGLSLALALNEALGVWGAIEGGAQAILDMLITDSRVADPVRPVFLTFDGEVEPGEPLAHMVESGALTAALIAACRAARV